MHELNTKKNDEDSIIVKDKQVSNMKTSKLKKKTLILMTPIKAYVQHY